MKEWPKEYAEIIEVLDRKRLPPRIKITPMDRGVMRRAMDTGADGLNGSIVVGSRRTRQDLEDLMQAGRPYSYQRRDADKPEFLIPVGITIRRESFQVGTNLYEAEIELTFMLTR